MKSSFVALVVAVSLLAAGCASTGGDFDDADEAVLADPGAAYHVAMGNAAYQGAEYGKAIGWYRRAVESEPDNLEARLGAAEAHLALGNGKEAFVVFSDVATSAQGDMRLKAEQGKGLSLLVLKEEEAAFETLHRVATEDASSWRAWNALGQIYDHRGDWTAADAAYARALTGSPVPHVVNNNWGMSLMAQSRYPEATEKFAAALRAAPDFDVARNNYRVALAMQGRYAEALREVDDEDRPTVLNNVGYAAYLRGDYEEAEKYLTWALEESPRFNETAWKNLQRLRSP